MDIDITRTVRLAVTYDAGPVEIRGFVTCGRSAALPFGAEWSPVPGWWNRPPTDTNIRAEIAKSHPLGTPQLVGYRLMDEAEVLPARTYRDAWIDAGDEIGHDIDKAKAIALARVRVDRASAFDDLDAQWMKAMGQKDQAVADAIEAERQVLRDKPQVLTDAFKAVSTVAEIDALVKG